MLCINTQKLDLWKIENQTAVYGLGANLTIVWASREAESLGRRKHRSHPTSFSKAAPCLEFSKRGPVGSGISQVTVLQVRGREPWEPTAVSWRCLSPHHQCPGSLPTSYWGQEKNHQYPLGYSLWQKFYHAMFQKIWFLGLIPSPGD